MTARLGGSFLPAPRVASCVEYGENDHSMFCWNKENLVREASHQCPAQIFVNDGKLLRVAEYGGKCGVKVEQKIGPESGDAILLPFKSGAQVLFRLGTDNEFERHRRILIRSRTTSQGEPLSGSAW